MKKTFLTFITSVALSASLWAQAPQAFNYQGVARDLSGTALATKNISVKASILDGSLTGTVVYAETHAIATNQFGLFSLAIGTGTVANGTFSTTNWASGNKYLKIEIDPNGGSSYTLSGTTQLLSVPYAMYAGKAGDSKWSDNSAGINYNTGKVGIGTATPTAWLSIEKNVSGSDRPLLSVDNLSNLNDSYSGTSFSAGTGTNKNSLQIQVNSEGYFPALGTSGQSFITAKQLVLQSQPSKNVADGFVSISTGGTFDGLNTSAERMRVTYDGKVGIGTKTPFSTINTSGNYPTAGWEGLHVKSLNGTATEIIEGSNGSRLHFAVNNGANGKNFVIDNTSNTSDGNSMLVFRTLTDGLTCNTMGMQLHPNGNIKIGGTCDGSSTKLQIPKAKLQITAGDVYLDDATKGIIMKNAANECYRVTVGTAGALVSTLITCP